MRLSLAMIVRNSEAVIDRCLESVKDIFDEIIIVDTGSTDKTKEIVRKYTDKIFDFPWINDFAAARNFAFDQCNGDFQTWLDSDDVILPEDAQKIKNLDLSDKEIVISPYIYSHDEYGKGSSVVPRERIIRRSLGLRWEGRIHEIIPLSAKTYQADFEVHHHRQGMTSDRNLTMLEQIVKEEPDNPRYTYYLGQEYFDVGRYDDAIIPLTKFINDKQGWWEDHYRACDKLIQCYQNAKNEDKMKEYFYKDIDLEPRRAEPYYYMGWHYHMKNEWKRAIHWYEIAASLKHPPELLATYLPEHYSWLPCLNLCVCYNGIGDIEKAYECNKKVLSYRPNDPRAVNNDSILSRALKEKTAKAIGRKDGDGKKLNVGCGGMRLEGYVNADLFKGAAVDEVFDMDQIPYLDGTIEAIHSSHSLEHVPFVRAEGAIREWVRVLRPGGALTLLMPDFERCCQAYIDAPLEAPTFMQCRAWFKATIYGIQQSQAGEPDDAQFHRCGFSKEEIKIVLERNGFKVLSVENYKDRPEYGTPSMEIHAIKPSTVPDTVTAAVADVIKASVMPRVGWLLQGGENWTAAQSRIRVLRVNQWLQAMGYCSGIVSDYPGFNDYEICVIGKGFDGTTVDNIQTLKQAGKFVIGDICESLFEFPYFKEVLENCDLVVCCSRELARLVSEQANPNVIIIEDAYE